MSIAAAMKHFGLTDWVAVSTPEHLEGMWAVLKNHRAQTEFTPEVLRLRRVDTLAEAIADCSWVVGTTMRVLAGQPRFTARELAEVSAQRRDTRWALVFGAECNGLQKAEVEQCHAVSFIPASEEQPSLNLSQAVVVYAHELAAAGPTQERGDEVADDATLRALSSSIAARLTRADALAVDSLMSPLMRGSLTREEAQRWRAALAPPRFD